MADTPLQFEFAEGETLTVELYPDGSDAIANGAGDSATEATNRDGTYSITVAEALTGLHSMVIMAGGVAVATQWVYIAANDTTTYYASRERAVVLIKAKTDNLPADPAGVSATRDAILNRLLSGNHDTVDTLGGIAQAIGDIISSGRIDANLTAVEGTTAFDGQSAKDLLLLFGAALLGTSSNNGNTFRAADGSKPRITATVDANNNRTAVILDPD